MRDFFELKNLKSRSPEYNKISIPNPKMVNPEFASLKKHHPGVLKRVLPPS
jgi:hypothetical protein